MNRSLIALVALLFLAPSASAFSIDFEIDDSPLAPEVENREGTLTITATCEEVWERTPPAFSDFLAVDIETTSDHPGITFSGPTRAILTTDECSAPTDDEISTEQTVVLNGRRTVPAFTSIPYTITATLEGGELGENATHSADGNAQVKFLPHFSAAVDAPIQVLESGAEATYRFTITNLANGEGKAQFSFEDSPPPGLDVLLPADTIVPFDPEGIDNTVTADLVLQLDSEAEDILPLADFVINVEFSSSQDPSSSAEPVSQALAVRIQDSRGTPAPTPILAIGSLIGLAIIGRRRP